MIVAESSESMQTKHTTCDRKLNSDYVRIACVTGASGIVGKRIVTGLLDLGWRVRILSRRRMKCDGRVSLFNGDICDIETLRGFVSGADAMFHCAAELIDESMMWSVNVEGTRNVVTAVLNEGMTYFCHISSAGVVGNAQEKIVDESSACQPYNIYEKTKLEAEKLVEVGVAGSRVVILRPTNVVAEEKPGVLCSAFGGISNRLKLFLKGGECAHVVHADDVAAAALYLMDCDNETPECYFVSCDDAPLNTYAGVAALYNAFQQGSHADVRRTPLHVPICVAYAVRCLLRGRRNRGDVVYSSKKLLSTGYQFQVGFEGAVARMARSQI